MISYFAWLCYNVMKVKVWGGKLGLGFRAEALVTCVHLPKSSRHGCCVAFFKCMQWSETRFTWVFSLSRRC